MAKDDNYKCVNPACTARYETYVAEATVTISKDGPPCASCGMPMQKK
jgi:hypothetical protein